MRTLFDYTPVSISPKKQICQKKTIYQAGSHCYPLQTIEEVKYKPKLLSNTFPKYLFLKGGMGSVLFEKNAMDFLPFDAESLLISCHFSDAVNLSALFCPQRPSQGNKGRREREVPRTFTNMFMIHKMR